MYGWPYIAELLFWNPVEFFRTHPNVASVSIEEIDDNETTTEVSRESDVDPIPLALVLRRCELDYITAYAARLSQLAFFRQHNLGLPPRSSFTSTLFGR